VTTPRRNRVDLHCHTTRSDGVHAPRDLYEQMRAYGMRVVAITDHDSVDAYRDLADIAAAGQGEGQAPGPRLIPGVEINSIAGRDLARHGLGRNGAEVHILGFGMSMDDADFDAALRRQRDARTGRFWQTVDLLRTLGRPIDDQLAATPDDLDAALGRPHIARAMIAAGYVGSVDEAFDEWLSWGRPAYVPRHGLGPREAIEAIVAAGGLASLAHSPNAAELLPVVERLQEWGLGGLEVHYRTFLPETVRKLRRFAAERGLVATGGSDYHGDTMSYAAAQATTYVPDLVADELLAAIAARQVARSLQSRASR
jgi:predicted metal-dependent phosphoesterase TrpH